MVTIIMNIVFFILNLIFCINNYDDKNYENAIVNAFASGVTLAISITLILLKTIK